MKKVFLLLIAFTHLSILKAQYCIEDRFTQNDYFAAEDVVSLVDVSYGFADNWYLEYPQPILNSFDISYPDMDVDPLEKRPLIVFAHGGGFWGGEKESFSYHLQELAKSGYVVASMNYRKGWDGSPVDCEGDPASLSEAVYRAMQDVQACIRYLVANADDYGIDTSMIIAGGESAGVYAMMNGIFMTEAEWSADHPTHVDLMGTLNYSTNNYTTDFSVKGFINMWGGMYDTAYMDKLEIVPMINFYGISDDVIPPTSGPIKFCEGYEMVYGAVSLQAKLNNEDVCNVMHKNLMAGHEAYLPDYTAANIACFVKTLLCNQCVTEEVNFSEADCSALTEAVTVYDLKNTNLTLSPNPATTYISISCDSFDGLTNLIMITDVTGKEMARLQTNGLNTYQFDVSGFPAGVYLVTVIGEEVIGTEKLVIAK
jgi:hypothetical protein